MAADHKCRILFVIHHMGVGGAQKQVAEVTNRLDTDRFSCDIACVTSGGVNLDRSRGAREVFVLGADRMYDNRGLAAAARLARIIRGGGYKIVEAYLPAAHLFSALALVGVRRTALVAACRHVAGLDPGWTRAIRPLLDRMTWLYVANSHTVKRSFVERYGLPPSKVAVVHNIIDAPPSPISRREARQRLGLADGEFTVAAAGTFSPVKDYPTIIRAFAGLCRSGRPAALVVAGDGPLKSAAAALAQSAGLNGRVRFLGEVRDVHAVLAASDAFVHASKSEGMSNAVLEAMSAGLPVVASDIPANREVLGPNYEAFFAPGDWQGCLQGLQHFADDRQAAAALGKCCRARAIDAFSAERAITRRERIYTRLAGAIDESRS